MDQKKDEGRQESDDQMEVEHIPSTKVSYWEDEDHSSKRNGSLLDHKGLDERNQPDYHDKETKRIMRKIDWRLPPVLALLYLMSFLDRSNIGNAKIAGMEKDLHLTGSQYNIALTVFFFPYAIFMIPSNMVLKKVKPSLWLAIMMISWGTVMGCHGFVKTFGQLCACRALLGFCECGFTPAATYLLTTWYCRYELQTRVSLFFASATLAGAFSGILAYALEKMQGIGGYGGWCWIFFIEGAVTVAIGLSVYFILPNSPRSCSFLTDYEKDIVERRLQEDAGTKEGHTTIDDKFNVKYLTHTIKDWKLWLWAVAICGQSIPFYAFNFVCPTVIKELGYHSWQAQLLSVPVYAVACACTIIISLIADKRQRRWPFVVGPYCLAAAGLLACLCIPHPKLPGLTYAFLFCIPTGLSCGLVACLSWIGNNLAPSWRRSIGIAMTTTLANFGGAIGANIYLEEEKPRYFLGFGFSLGVIIAAMISVFFMKNKLTRINEQRDAMDVAAIKERWTEEQLVNMGDASPLYRYVI